MQDGVRGPRTAGAFATAPGATEAIPRGAVWATLAACLVCAVALAALRGGWLDEFWTVWETDGALGLREAYRSRWVLDTPHPPLFYFLSWLAAPLTGDDLVARRLLHLLPLVLLTLPTLLLHRRADGRVPLLFAVTIASNPFVLAYFGEHRSYFLSLAAISNLVLVARLIHLEVADTGRAPGLLPLLWFGLLILLAVNLHYAHALVVCTFIGCLVLYWWWRGSRAAAVWTAAMLVGSLVPLLYAASIAFQIAATPSVPWIGLVRGWMNMGLVLAAAAAGNLVLLVLASKSGVELLRARPWSSTRQDISPAIAKELSFLAVLLAALLIVVLGFAVLHAITRAITPRLFLGVLPIAVAALCELAGLRRIGTRAFLLVCVNAVMVAVTVAFLQAGNKRWEHHAAAIAAQVRACPDTKVLALDPVASFASTLPVAGVPNIRNAMAKGYELIARKHGFDVTVLPPGAARTEPARACPTLIWIEHNFFRPELTASDAVGAANLAITEAQRTGARASTEGPHVLIVVPPAP